MIRRRGFAAVLLALAALLPAHGAVGEDVTALVTSISMDEVKALVTENGYDVGSWQDGLIIRHPASDDPLLVVLSECQGARCTWMAIHTLWPLGQRKAAIAAAQDFEHVRPTVIVAFYDDGQEVAVSVGRDLYLGSGVTRLNINANIVQVELMAMSFREALVAVDPGYEAFLDGLERVAE